MSAPENARGLRRFFFDGPLRIGNTVPLDPDTSHYIQRVLRLRTGAQLVLFDPEGLGSVCTIVEDGRGGVRVRVDRQGAPETRRVDQISIAVGLPKGNKLDEVIRRCCELGVDRLLPMITERAIPKANDSDRKRERWWKISVDAARQCGGKPMVIPPVSTLHQVVEGHDGPVIVLWEDERSGSLFTCLEAREPGANWLFLVGPEGGWSGREIAWIREQGGVTASLGPRILRAETAPVVVAALVQSLRGDMR